MPHQRLFGGDALARAVTAARSGDERAFAEVVERTSPKVYALCLRLSGNEHDARDIMQETYLRVFRSLDSFREESSFTTWIYRIAANCASTHLTKRRNRTERVQHLDVELIGNLAATSSELDPELATESIEERERLVKALGLLPFSLRSVVVLCDVYDLSHEEIATELGISRAAVKVRLHRARRTLYESLFATPAHGPAVIGDGQIVTLAERSVRGPGRRGAKGRGSTKSA